MCTTGLQVQADVGRAIHRQQCEAQDEGGAMAAPGVLAGLTADDLAEYDRFENGDGPGPFGAKGIGESGLMPTAPAIANALARAIGVRLKELPLPPERVRAAIAG